MAHRLFPVAEGEYLSPAEVVRRLRAEFEFVEADAAAGAAVVADMIEQFRRMNAPQDVIDAHRAVSGRAVRVVVSDRKDFDDDFVSFTALPGTALFVGYHSGRHEAAAAPLLGRACRALRYRPELA